MFNTLFENAVIDPYVDQKNFEVLFIGLKVVLLGFALALTAWYVYAQAISTEKREVLLTTTFKIGAGEQKFKAFYLSAPAERFDIEFNVLSGSIKFSAWQASVFENSLGYFEYNNGTAVEKRQVWFYEGNNGTAEYAGDSVNEIWYIHFYNEDSYEKEVYLKVTKSGMACFDWRE